jgi:hypothetical protein
MTDRFPQFPPFGDEPAPRPVGILSASGELIAWSALVAAAAFLCFIAVGYLLAAGPADILTYIHGVLVGILLGFVIILAALTVNPARRADTRRADGIDRTPLTEETRP